MFCLGAFSLCAQVLFTREMLVAFLGNELSIGAIFGSWLVGIGVGATSFRIAARRGGAPGRTREVTALVVAAAAVLLPAQIYAVRIVRSFLPVAIGEYVPLGWILATAFLSFLPTCLAVGFLFPCACSLMKAQADIGAADSAAPAIGKVYAAEAAGSMAGGIAVTFFLLPVMTTGRIVALTCALALIASTLFATSGRSSSVTGAVAILFIGLAALPQPMAHVEEAAARARWRSFEVLAPESEQVRLVHSTDSAYQNLALIEMEDRYTLYGNGKVMFSFPDVEIDEAHIHFVMAQKPHAGRVLLVGGNPMGDIPELLKYPVESIVHVDLDPGVGDLLRELEDGRYERIVSNPRVTAMSDDAMHFVRNCTNDFDVILLNAAQPYTASDNRFYTLEFYRALREILAPGGMVHTSLQLTPELFDEAADLGASVDVTLQEVFAVVLVTGGDNVQFFAGDESSGLTFERNELVRRSDEISPDTKYFVSRYFLDAYELSPGEIARVQARFADADVSLNTALRPVTYYYGLFMWSSYSGSGMAPVLDLLRKIRPIPVAAVFVCVGAVCLLLGVAARRGQSIGWGWARSMYATAVASTGLCGMSLEILLIFAFQNLYGCLYARIGLIVAMFMGGLVAGAMGGNAVARRSLRASARAMVSLEVALLFLPLAVPPLVIWATRTGLPGFAQWAVEIVIYVAVIILGALVGMQFPVANRLFCSVGGEARSASITDAADHFGAAVGSLVVGVVLVPVIGIAASCAVISAIKIASLACVVSGMIAVRSSRSVR